MTLTLKSDERILGDSDFVEEVLYAAQERLEKVSLCRERGVTLEWAAQRIADLLGIEVSDVWRHGNGYKTVQARSILCYWAINDLGLTATAAGKALLLTRSGASRAALRGEKLVREKGWSLTETEISRQQFTGSPTPGRPPAPEIS